MEEQEKKKLWTLEVNGRVWDTYPTQRVGVSNWKTLAYNKLFKKCRVVLYAPSGIVLKEKLPKAGED